MAPRLKISGILEGVVAHRSGTYHTYSARIKLDRQSTLVDDSRTINVPIGRRQYRQYLKILQGRKVKPEPGEEYVRIKGTLSSRVEEEPPF